MYICANMDRYTYIKSKAYSYFLCDIESLFFKLSPPLSFTQYLCLSISLSVSLFLPLSRCLSLSLHHSLSHSLSLSLSPALSLCLSLSLHPPLSLSLHPSLTPSLSHSYFSPYLSTQLNYRHWHKNETHIQRWNWKRLETYPTRRYRTYDTTSLRNSGDSKYLLIFYFSILLIEY